MRISIEGEPKEIAALVLAVQEGRGENIDLVEFTKSVIQEINRRTQESGRSVLLM